ncbi:unnamed protein product, partial [Prorocentrum cordatum]
RNYSHHRSYWEPRSSRRGKGRESRGSRASEKRALEACMLLVRGRGQTRGRGGGGGGGGDRGSRRAARSKRELSAPRVGSSSRPPELLASWCSGRGARQASCCHRPPRWAVVPSIAASDNRRGGGKEGGGRPGGVRGGRRTERGGTKGDASSSAARSALVKRPSFKTKRGSRRRAPGPRQRGRAVRRAPAARSSLCSAQRPAEAQHWEEAPRQLQAGSAAPEQGYWPLAEGTAARTKGQSHFPGAGSGRSAIGAEYAGQNQS